MTSLSNQTELINWATDGNNVGTLTQILHYLEEHGHYL